MNEAGRNRSGHGTGRTGRRPGRPDTRGHILEVARSEFIAHGYQNTTIRGVARAAEVDPALVHRYFGNKESLFNEAIRMGFDPVEIIEGIVSGGTDNLGLRIARMTASVWDSPMGQVWVSAIQKTPALIPVYLGFVHEPIVGATTRLLGIPRSEAQLRVGMLISLMSGIATIRYISKIEPMASIPTNELVQLIAPILQHLIFSDLRTARVKRRRPPSFG